MSTKFTEYKGLDLPKIASEILDYWKENKIFEKSISSKDDNKPFIFFEGPPSANGLPGVHHVLARSIKDIFPRYKSMKGFQVKRKAGWDTHGLPIELGVEKELGITKEDIGTKISVEDYNKACKKAVMRYTDVWNDLTEKMGYWVDMEDPYVTYKSKYMETVWWLLSQIYSKGLLYKGYTIQPYSPKAGTGLSSHELNQPGTYQDVSDTTVVAQFKADASTLPEELKAYKDNLFFLAWTTTPWTLPSNTALTVGPKIDYVVVKTYNQYTFEPITVIVAKKLVAKQFNKRFSAVETEEELSAYKEGDKKIPYLIVSEHKGKDLVGIRYEQLLSYAKPYENPQDAFRVISGDFVTTEDGTGIVHTAPTFGADDALVAKQASPQIPPLLVKDDNDNLVPLVDLQGKFTKHMGEFAGKYVKNEYYDEGQAPEKSVDVELAIKLKEENRAFHVEKYVHSYPNCWRTDKPILYYPLDSWFIKVTDVKDRMHELNTTINWKPKATGEGRFGNWLANANDWNLSRSRYWGIPLPIWRTEDGKEELMIGSVEDLKIEMKKSVEAGIMEKDIFEEFVVGDNSEENYDKIDLHKNIVDQIILVSSKGEPMRREADLIDVWFDSGSMPYAQFHYPFENKRLVETTWRKADFIAEGVDQTRGWFYTLHTIATMIFDDVAYKNVVSNGLVLDKNGQKMSKRLGNAVDPFETLSVYGPDATRWYMISNANPWDNLKFDIEGIEEVRRKFFGTLYNTYSFFSLYANLDGFTYDENPIPLEQRPEIDRWILSELHSLIKDVDSYYNDYDATRATRAISEFVQENLSNWFVRLSRRRYWKGDYETDKISAYQTLFECLLTVSKLGAPVSPFFMDKLYRDLIMASNKEPFESVHLAEFPIADETVIDKSLESKMKKAQIVSSLVLSLRRKEQIRVRQPLQRIMIPVLNDQQRSEILAVADLIKTEVNVKTIELLDDASDILVKQIKPNFKVLGPRFGKDMRFVASAISEMNAKEITKIEQEGEISIDVNGNLTKLTLEDVEITSQDIEGWLVANNSGITVALDVTISEDLRKEGIAREFVNRIQNLRKDSGYEVSDTIAIKIQKDGKIETAVTDNMEYIKNETLATSLDLVEELDNGTVVEFDDVTTKLFIDKN
ncbi:isoleucine--tRNA ligase [Croceibacter atlanticus]|jgi:isoleucyl-tRNA synthetase|uniref:Isoleucine--tRNA ligase n=1 Tax=Croceibacter atlanticus (strain ATCC BAA-628 / JCM 21780 / CIP 108009 / IAM 15332 / KCTC 12090 / HTCC2559) TaxID=216432 RepID=A3U5S0_CROAH|nr:isoleucine--tRNA ligase [Croceibacter atlanticus]EAP87587.1 isoleucyl-tRNA synthetase [Croceibacter atlanticus HTCC2559]|tara:strand:+ start:71906 stop:75310 length:3405 start_codon:yes stop_codon:yes gene_type:complete